MVRPPAGAAGQAPVGALVALGVVLAVIAGLAVGAVVGLSQGGPSGSASPSSTPPTAPAPTASASRTATSPSSTPTRTSPSASPTSSAPAPTGAVPPAPATTSTSVDGWRLGPWRITNTGGALGVVTTVRNTATGTRSADLVLYVYVDGAWIATTTAQVTDVPAGGSVPVAFTGTDPWKPGQKVLLLQVG